jgi:hypothetical protein
MDRMLARGEQTGPNERARTGGPQTIRARRSGPVRVRQGVGDVALQLRPGGCQTRVQEVGVHLVQGYPAQFVGLGVGQVCPRIALGVGNHGVVAPVAVVVAEDGLHVEVLGLDAGFLPGLTGGCGHGVFVRVECTSGQCPGPAAVGPRSPELQEHVGVVHVPAHEQQARSAEEAPVRPSAEACNPSVPVMAPHRLRIVADGTPLASIEPDPGADPRPPRRRTARTHWPLVAQDRAASRKLTRCQYGRIATESARRIGSDSSLTERKGLVRTG